MFKITISRNYRYKYTIFRNRRRLKSFNTKKQAKEYLTMLYQEFSLLNRSQTVFSVFPLFLRGGDVLVVYHSRRSTLANSETEEFKDYFEIKREFNENY